MVVDVNECTAKRNPCEGQTGAPRCVNIDGGYICCEEDLDDEQCIRGSSLNLRKNLEFVISSDTVVQ